jgi:hypothetical protein
MERDCLIGYGGTNLLIVKDFYVRNGWCSPVIFFGSIYARSAAFFSMIYIAPLVDPKM